MLNDLKGNSIDFSAYQESDVLVLITLSPDCPLCQKYSLSFRELDSIFVGKKAAFVGVFPGTYYELEEMKSYVFDYEIPFPCVLDPDMKLTARLGAEVTPEVFVFNNAGELLYSGAIDNWAVTVRKHRQVVSEFYLRDAIESALSGKVPVSTRVEPVGCLIQ